MQAADTHQSSVHARPGLRAKLTSGSASVTPDKILRSRFYSILHCIRDSL